MVSQESLVVPCPARSNWGPHSFRKLEFHKHSVDKDVKSFCGWETLNKIIETSMTVGSNSTLNAGFIATLFETGCRVSEALALKANMFSVYKGCQPRLVLVKDMPLLKRYKKTEGYVDAKGKTRYKTERINALRDISFRADEALVKPMIEWLIPAWKSLESVDDWLFPSPLDPSKHISRKWAYLMISKTGDKLGMELWPHWFRAMRASQLASEYDLAEASLLEWFEWTKWETAKKYTKFGVLGLAKKMGVTFRRDRSLKLSELESLKVE